MRKIIRYILIIALFLPGGFVKGPTSIAASKFGKRGNLNCEGKSGSVLKDIAVQVRGDPPRSRKFDEFDDVNCEDEAARLDNLAEYLKQEPTAKVAILFFGGKRFRGKLPRRGEAAARAARLKSYLVSRRR